MEPEREFRGDAFWIRTVCTVIAKPIGKGSLDFTHCHQVTGTLEERAFNVSLAEDGRKLYGFI
jgi:hypothetical protein